MLTPEWVPVSHTDLVARPALPDSWPAARLHLVLRVPRTLLMELGDWSDLEALGDRTVMGRETKPRLGANLKALRERRGMTQVALATKVGISREYLARLETGVQEPSLAMLRRIAAIVRGEPPGPATYRVGSEWATQRLCRGDSARLCAGDR